MECILLFLNKYSNVFIAFFAFLTTIATFLIWNVSRKQTRFTYLMAKASEQPIITINRFPEYLRDYILRNRNSRYLGNDRVLTIQVSNIGKGSAYNLKIEQHGQETKKIDILPVGEKHEYFIPAEEIRSEKTSPTVRVTYQDIFENELTVGESV